MHDAWFPLVDVGEAVREYVAHSIDPYAISFDTNKCTCTCSERRLCSPVVKKVHALR